MSLGWLSLTGFMRVAGEVSALLHILSNGVLGFKAEWLGAGDVALLVECLPIMNLTLCLVPGLCMVPQSTPVPPSLDQNFKGILGYSTSSKAAWDT